VRGCTGGGTPRARSPAPGMFGRTRRRACGSARLGLARGRPRRRLTSATASHMLRQRLVDVSNHLTGLSVLDVLGLAVPTAVDHAAQAMPPLCEAEEVIALLELDEPTAAACRLPLPFEHGLELDLGGEMQFDAPSRRATGRTVCGRRQARYRSRGVGEPTPRSERFGPLRSCFECRTRPPRETRVKHHDDVSGDLRGVSEPRMGLSTSF